MTDVEAVELACDFLRGTRQPAGTMEAMKAAGALRDMLRRDWAVRVLDAEHQATNTAFPLFAEWDEETKWLVEGRDSVGPIGRSDTSADAARLAAALVVLPTLPAKVRANLGECP